MTTATVIKAEVGKVRGLGMKVLGVFRTNVSRLGEQAGVIVELKVATPIDIAPAVALGWQAFAPAFGMVTLRRVIGGAS